MSEIKTITVGGTTYDLSSGGGLLPHLIISADTETEVTVTKGTTEITAEETSEGIYECDVPEYGTYTIEGTVNGNEMTGELVVDDVKIYNFYFVTPVPEGATVTPTNDIQTWLHCANITDKTYTTLAEVLADETTFEMLLADNNACDYMARSTDWAVAEGLVPVMTSNTTPEGVASASSEYMSAQYGNYPAYKAFNEDSATSGWVPASDGKTYQWIAYQFDTPVIVNRVYCKGFSANTSKTWQLQGSNTGNENDWHDIGNTFTVIAGSGVEVTAHIENTTAYSHYRLYSNTSVGASNDYGLKLQFYKADITTSEDAMSMVGHYDYCSEKLLGNMTWRNAICNSEYFESVLNTKVPAMTSATAPSGEVIANSYYTTYYPYYVFSSSANTSSSYTWEGQGNGSNVGWIGYEFTSPVVVNRVYLENRNEDSVPRAIKKFKVQGYNGSSWVDVSTELTNASSAKKVGAYYTFSNTTAYTKYRIFITDVYDTSYYGIGKLQFYGRKAIQNEYYPLVPVMTSNTTPSGEVSANDIYSSDYDAWKAFNGNWNYEGTGSSANRGWETSHSTVYSAGDWLEYDFTQPCIVQRVKLGNLITSALHDIYFKVQAYNGSTWVDLSDELHLVTTSTNAMNADYFNFSNSTSYTKYRIYITQNGTNGNGLGIKVQFFDKYDTGIIHSASNDTIYYLEDGDPVIVATTNSEGIGEIDFSMLEDNVVLYSSVAKDPTNLSNAYHRAIRITNHQYGGTKEAYLMPDTIRTLYWFGYEDADLEDCNTGNGWTCETNWSWGTAPTHNTNDIYLNASSSYSDKKYAGVGYKKSLPYSTTLNCIARGVYSSDNIAGSLYEVQNKNFNSQVSYNQYGTSASDVKYTLSVTKGNYVSVNAWRDKQTKLSALWYEKENVA